MEEKCILCCGGENIIIHGRIILKCTWNKYDGCVCGQDECGSGYGPVEGSYENGNEPSGSIKRN